MPKKKHGSVFYYLVIERGKETFFLETLKNLAERWSAETPRRVLWVTIALDVPVGYIGAAIKSTRKGHSLSSEAHLPTVISETAESNYQSIALYVSTYLGQEEDVKKMIADLDYRWKYAVIEPVDGIASSISTSTIDFGDIDQWLVACLGCCYMASDQRRSGVAKRAISSAVSGIKSRDSADRASRSAESERFGLVSVNRDRQTERSKRTLRRFRLV